MKFTLHTLDTAPEASRPLLEKSLKAFGRIPGLHAVMAESPQLLEAYQKLSELFTRTSFNAEEITVVWMAINVENECHYCVPAHTAIAHAMKVDPALVEALRNGEPLADEKLQVLRDTTVALVRNRGHLSEDEMARFEQAGYGPRQLLEIILGIAHKTMSNYTNHLANTPVDEVVKKYAWEKKA